MDAISEFLRNPWSGPLIAVVVAMLAPLLEKPASWLLDRSVPRPAATVNSGNQSNVIQTGWGNSNVTTQVINRTTVHVGSDSTSSGSDDAVVWAILALAVCIFLAITYVHVGVSPLRGLAGLATGGWLLALKSSWQYRRDGLRVPHQELLIAAAGVTCGALWCCVYLTTSAVYHGQNLASVQRQLGSHWRLDSWSLLDSNQQWLAASQTVGNIIAVLLALLVLLWSVSLRAKFRTMSTAADLLTNRLAKRHPTGWIGFALALVGAILAMGLCGGQLIPPVRNHLPTNRLPSAPAPSTGQLAPAPSLSVAHPARRIP